MPKGTKGFQRGNSVGKVFTQSRQPQKRGRKPALYKQLLKKNAKIGEIELSKEDYHRVLHFLIERTPGELEKLAKDYNTPVWVSNIISALFSDVKAGRITTLNMVFDRLFGKATLSIDGEVETNVHNTINVDFSILTTEELLNYDHLLDKLIANETINQK